MPLVSIITPVYNAARWLPETLASVHGQIFTNWEHLLIDDGSEDSSIAVIKAASLRDARIRLLHTPKNGGPAAARNVGIDGARGRFVAFLDADDLWRPEKLACTIPWMIANRHAFIYHDYRHMSHDGTRTGRLVHGPNHLTRRTLHTRRGYGGCMSMVIDRQYIPTLHFPEVEPHHAEDFCLWSQLISDGHIGHRLPVDLGRYRLSPKSRSSNKLGSALNAWYIYRNFSKLPLTRCAFWWAQYAWSTFWLYRFSQPVVHEPAMAGTEAFGPNTFSMQPSHVK
ncbi:MAG: glycosyltransferase family 2 protein [Acidobacteria bacterium]|nr:glycosyltransferase family 2 protein [Acidobacteriota bacterium]